MLVMTGRGTMWGLSRWAGTGGSSRTLQRFFATALPWATLFGVFFRHHLYRAAEVSLLGGAEVVATKAGQHPSGLDRFWASLSGQPVPGRAVFTLARVRVQARRACPRRVEQVVRSDAEQATSKAKAASKKATAPCAQRRPGRPKGSKNTSTADGPCTPEWVRIPGWRDALRHLIAGVVSWTSGVLDGPFGNHHALQRARQHPRHLISQLRCDAAWSFPSPGPSAGRGPHRQ